jgi:hypothetical protein
MRYPNIEKALADGYELQVKRDWRGDGLHALVHLGTVGSSHNFIGKTMTAALEGLDMYLARQRTESASATPNRGSEQP